MVHNSKYLFHLVDMYHGTHHGNQWIFNEYLSDIDDSYIIRKRWSTALRRYKYRLYQTNIRWVMVILVMDALVIIMYFKNIMDIYHGNQRYSANICLI
jgi:hypothetical protein